MTPESQSNSLESSEKVVLRSLAEKTMTHLETLPQPIVRVCGPLTTGGFGYEENTKRLEQAEQILHDKGMTVFRFGDSEMEIQGKGYSHAAIMDEFHQPILASGLIADTYFLSGWEASQGATIERDLARKYDIGIKEFPEEWFQK